MRRKLSLKVWHLSDNYKAIQVDEQTHRGDNFCPLDEVSDKVNKDYFLASNGFALGSDAELQLRVPQNILYVLGDCTDEDDKIILVKTDSYKLIKQAVKEYNEEFCHPLPYHTTEYQIAIEILD